MRSCNQVSQDLPIEIMLDCPKCTQPINNPTNNPTTCGDETRSVTFNKDLDRMGTSKRKQKALLHREKKENAINTCRLETQKEITFTNINILVVFIHSNQVVEFEVHQMMHLLSFLASAFMGPHHMFLFLICLRLLLLSLASAFLGAHLFLSFPVLYLHRT
jgi:hypothetical protein